MIALFTISEVGGCDGFALGTFAPPFFEPAAADAFFGVAAAELFVAGGTAAVAVSDISMALLLLLVFF